MATPTGGAVHQLPETPNDVMSVRRLGPDMFECTLRSAAIWQGDAQLLMSLPHGVARLATLQMRERVAQAKAKTKAKAKAEEEEAPREKDEPAESSGSRRSGGEHGEARAPEHGGGAAVHGGQIAGTSAKRQRTFNQMSSSGAAGQVGSEHGQAGASEHGGGEHGRMAGTSAMLNTQNTA